MSEKQSSDFLNDLSNIAHYYENLNRKISDKDDEILDLLHILELMELSDDEFEKTANKLKEVAVERREYKNIKMVLGKLKLKGIDLYQLNDEVLAELSDNLEEDNRHYNLRSKNTQKFLEDLSNKEIDKDYIKKNFTVDSLDRTLEGVMTYRDKQLAKHSTKPLTQKGLNKELKKLRKNG